jgi:hypothetical protein
MKPSKLCRADSHTISGTNWALCCFSFNDLLVGRTFFHEFIRIPNCNMLTRTVGDTVDSDKAGSAGTIKMEFKSGKTKKRKKPPRPSEFREQQVISEKELNGKAKSLQVG